MLNLIELVCASGRAASSGLGQDSFNMNVNFNQLNVLVCFC